MAIADVLASIDIEISKLQRARALLSGGEFETGLETPAAPVVKGKRGRPKGSKTAPAVKAARRPLSPEARTRIAEAQRKRWAAQKKA